MAQTNNRILDDCWLIATLEPLRAVLLLLRRSDFGATGLPELLSVRSEPRFSTGC